MLNAFPHLLSWSLLSPLILRILAGSYFVTFGYKGLTSEWALRQKFFASNKVNPPALFATATAVVDILAGLLLIMGFETQVVALCLAVVCFTALAVKSRDNTFPGPNSHVYFILSIVLISLFITGAGYFGMDLPL